LDAGPDSSEDELLELDSSLDVPDPELAPELELEEDDEEVDEEDAVPAEVVPNGFLLLPPVAVTKLRVVAPYLLCSARLTLKLSEETAEPVLYAQIHFEAVSVKLIEPPDQLLQFEHRMFAVMTLLAIPDPARSVTLAVVSTFGALSPVPRRVDKVTFVPAELAYIMNIFEPAILDPWPTPIQL
jgi:hypothetical protein